LIELVGMYTTDSHAMLRIIIVNTTKNAIALADARISVNESEWLFISIIIYLVVTCILSK